MRIKEVESLLDQTEKNLELAVINDAPIRIEEIGAVRIILMRDLIRLQKEKIKELEKFLVKRNRRVG